MATSAVRFGDGHWHALLAFLERETDRVRDLLVRADSLAPLGERSDFWLLRANSEILGLALAFPLWPSCPSLALKGRSPAIEEAFLSRLVAEGLYSNGYVICDLCQESLYLRHGQAEGRHLEWQYTLAGADWEPRPLEGVRRAELAELDAFYTRCEAGAWNPIQFETGPYFVIEEAGRVVAAAGTHFRYAGLAQIGNVMTDPAARGRGFASRVTAAVAQTLAHEGTETISLFVAEDNAPARHVYEKLGFRALRPLAAFRWRALA